ncbi:MucBP domain-containing protein [Lactococcus taiwanensis]|uniref:MucBP domain-containing protein n=1 Tax=Lactococcus taiwanensis TaxID=1151742 RepID=UPI0019068252|nr:MucBP domain-containing protein [Lactococcus taiwanensis]
MKFLKNLAIFRNQVIMKGKKRLITLCFLLVLSCLITISAKAATTNTPMVINSQGTLTNGLQYAAKGTISSIADISNGSFDANLFVNSGQAPATVQKVMLNGAIQVGSNSSFIVKQGTPVSQSATSDTFSVNSTDATYPSVLVTHVGQTQAGESLDVLVTVQQVTDTTPDKSTVTLSSASDGSINVGTSNLDGVKVSYQFQDSNTHQPVTLLIFPVIGDVDYTQQFALNGTVLGAGANLSQDGNGLFTSDGTPVNGFADYPLGGLLYEFYGDTLISTYNNRTDNTVGDGGFAIFGMYGSIKDIRLTYPNSSATLHFIDAATKQEIQAPKTFTGSQFSDYNLTAPALSGYRLDTNLTDSSKLSSTYQTTNTAINLYYDKQSTVTVHYLDSTTGQAIQAPQVNTGYATDTYQLTAPSLSGYRLNQLKSASVSLSGIYSNSNTDLNLYYDKQSTVTLHLLDAFTGQVIQAPQVTKGYVNDAYQLTTPNLANYRLDKKSPLTSLSGNYKAANTDITLYYDQAATVTLHLVDRTTSKASVLQSIRLDGYAGDAYTYRLPKLPLYQSPPNPTVVGNYTNQAQVVTVPYVKTAGTLTLKYVNAQTGKTLLPSEQYTSNLGDWQVIHIPNITNYDYRNTGVEVAFQQLLPHQSRTLYYDPNVDTVKVDFEDANGHVLAGSQTLTGYFGSSRVVKAQPIKGYQIASGQLSRYPVTFNRLYQHLVFKYQPIKEHITFHFVNDAGQKVYTSKTIMGTYGSAYHFQPSVPWYDSLTYASQKNITGKYSQPKTDITVHYTRRQASVTIIDKDNWGNTIKIYTLKSYEGLHYRSVSPYYWWLNCTLVLVSGEYRHPKQTIIVKYNHIPAYVNVTLTLDGQPCVRLKLMGYLNQWRTYHIPNLNDPWLIPYPGQTTMRWYFSTVNNSVTIPYTHIVSNVTFNYYGTNGIYLGTSGGISHWAGTVNHYSVPNELGYYDLIGGSYYSVFWQKYNQVVNVYYRFNPPAQVVYYSKEGRSSASLNNHISSNGFYRSPYGSISVSRSAYNVKEAELTAEGSYSSKGSNKKSSSGVWGYISNQYNLAVESESHFDWGSVLPTLTGIIAYGFGTAAADVAGADESYQPYQSTGRVRPDWGGVGDGIGEFGEAEEREEEERRERDGEGGTPNDPE